MAGPPPKEAFFVTCGIILECQPHTDSDSDSDYLCTILAPASLFKRPGDEPLDQIQIDVHLSSGLLYHAKLLACDFHSNLALITIISKSPLPNLTLKHIDDVVSIVPTTQPEANFPTLRPHGIASRPFKVGPATLIASVSITCAKPPHALPGSGTSCLSSSEKFSFDELYKIEDDVFLALDGAPALNTMGDLIGVVFHSTSMLPSNIISKWWNHYKSFGKFCRPFIGMKVVNLHELDLQFLRNFVTKFPGISTAVVVTKIKNDSPASRSGIRVNDVIVRLETRPMASKIKFYEAVWDNVGKAVAVDVLRVADGEELSVNLVIEEASPNKFKKWPHPSWGRVW